MDIDAEKIAIMLDFTDEQQINTTKLHTTIENGVERLRDRNPLLTEQDFDRPGLPRTLLQNYCRYAFSNAEEMFETNYAKELTQLRFRYEVKASENQE